MVYKTALFVGPTVSSVREKAFQSISVTNNGVALVKGRSKMVPPNMIKKSMLVRKYTMRMLISAT